MSTQDPQDIRHGWLKVARRIQAALSGNRGAAIVTIHVIVDENSDPMFWTAPDVILIEPKSQASALRRIIKALTGGG